MPSRQVIAGVELFAVAQRNHRRRTTTLRVFQLTQKLFLSEHITSLFPSSLHALGTDAVKRPLNVASPKHPAVALDTRNAASQTAATTGSFMQRPHQQPHKNQRNSAKVKISGGSADLNDASCYHVRLLNFVTCKK